MKHLIIAIIMLAACAVEAPEPTTETTDPVTEACGPRPERPGWYLRVDEERHTMTMNVEVWRALEAHIFESEDWTRCAVRIGATP